MNFFTKMLFLESGGSNKIIKTWSAILTFDLEHPNIKDTKNNNLHRQVFSRKTQKLMTKIFQKTFKNMTFLDDAIFARVLESSCF